MELAARGFHVVGLDLSTPLLVRGGEEAHRRGLTINFVRGDMRELDFEAQFDGAYCLFSTFGYFDDETNKKTAQNIARALKPHSVWVTAAPDPVVVRVANIQHLATPIRAQLTSPIGVIELAGVLHPTPAVGAEPGELAWTLIPALEGLDRGWYAGTVGWTDAIGDGEFCVALRCALLRDRAAHLYAGGGIVRDSDPASELAETEVKLQVMLPLLAG